MLNMTVISELMNKLPPMTFRMKNKVNLCCLDLEFYKNMKM